MSDDTQAANAPQDNAAPMMNMVGQYIRDLSFENPDAPGSILLANSAPSLNVSIRVDVKKQSEDIYAVELTLNAKANRETSVLFQAELVYGGVFRLKNIPDAQLGQLLMIECPRLIFPFARQVLASVTQQGGFPPLIMEPVDFTAMYRQNMAQLAAAQAQATGATN